MGRFIYLVCCLKRMVNEGLRYVKKKPNEKNKDRKLEGTKSRTKVGWVCKTASKTRMKVCQACETSWKRSKSKFNASKQKQN